ncbi:uncharacterized protein LOC141912186 [Tubulanus polymorphus]|uniref:uncharacterized protein LOC141912186 n=1 Tax=Tubulanus polymorphus TaxID=672921 RepID=UPI003DA69E23
MYGNNVTVLVDSDSGRGLIDILVWIVTYFVLPVTFLFGTIGNVLTLRVLMSGSRYYRTSTGIFMIALSLFDGLAVSVSVPVLFLRIAFTRAVLSPGFCSFYMALIFLCPSMSNMTLTFISFDRLIVVFVPMMARTLCTVRKAALCLTALIFTQIIFNYQLATNSVYIVSSNGVGDCDMLNYPIVRTVVRSLLRFWVPFLGICICNVSIAVKLGIYAQMRTKLSESTSNSKTAKTNISLTIMLCVVSFVFIVLNIPLLVGNCIRQISGLTLSVGFVNAISWITRACNAVNSAMNFYLYCLSSREFRQDFLSKFGRRKPTGAR